MGKKTRKKTYIRAWRKHRNMTQAKLAERIGLSEGQLSRIETGEQEYRQELLELIAEHLHCEPADLLMRDPSKPAAIWSIWETLSPVQKDQITAIAETIKRTGTEG